ncbi:hypothetical protein Ntsu_41150 [Nocardia sp. IFM 10818]
MGSVELALGSAILAIGPIVEAVVLGPIMALGAALGSAVL